MGCKRIFLNCTIILTYLDMQEESTMDTTGQRRIARLLKMIQDEKHQMLQKVKRIQEDALSSSTRLHTQKNIKNLERPSNKGLQWSIALSKKSARLSS